MRLKISRPRQAHLRLHGDRHETRVLPGDSGRQVFVSAPGDLTSTFAAEAMFYKGSLDKLGIEAD